MRFGHYREEIAVNMLHTFIATVAVCVAGLGASAQTTPTPSAEEFAAKAASSDMFELQAAELALERSQSEDVRIFAQMMVTDHTAASEKLKVAAEQDGIALPTEMAKADSEALETLKAATAEEFDAAYIESQIAAHQVALELLTAYGASGESAALKTHAQNTAGVVEMHLHHVEAMKAK